MDHVAVVPDRRQKPRPIHEGPLPALTSDVIYGQYRFAIDTLIWRDADDGMHNVAFNWELKDSRGDDDHFDAASHNLLAKAAG